MRKTRAARSTDLQTNGSTFIIGAYQRILRVFRLRVRRYRVILTNVFCRVFRIITVYLGHVVHVISLRLRMPRVVPSSIVYRFLVWVLIDFRFCCCLYVEIDCRVSGLYVYGSAGGW